MEREEAAESGGSAKGRWSRVRRPLAILGVTAALVGAGLWGAWGRFRGQVGEPSALTDDAWHRGHRILDRQGRLLRERPSALGLRGHEIALEEVGPRLIQATITSEDREFWAHDGVDRPAIARAALQSARHGRMVSGASTITQQLVKLLDGRGDPGERTLDVKLREVARAQNLEALLDKPTILALYLSRLPYGHGLVGPEAAANAYFGVHSRDLSWAQAAFLAVLPRAPSYLDPYRHLGRVRLRQAALLDALHEAGHLSAEDHRFARAEPIVLRELTHPFLAPHLVEALIADDLLSAGDETRTTLDLDLQRDVEGLTRTQMAGLADRGASDAAVLIVDNRSGEVLAYVGSADFHDPEISGQVDMIRAHRQPGSTLKPFVYALALTHGHQASEALADVATRFIEGSGTYVPVNFGRTFEGPIPLREALAGSLNVPAVRLAAELEGGELLDFLHQLGIESLAEPADHYGLALALGSGELALRELAAAYVALARGGERIPLRIRADDPAALGRELAEGTGVRVLDRAIAAQITEILADPLARVRGLHGRGPFTLQYPVAVKTGTSSGYRDTWAIGYTHERTVAVWVGNADGSGTERLTGASGAGHLFAAVMQRAMADVPTRDPLWDPALLAPVEVCALSGQLPGPACADHATRLVARASMPDEACSMHHHVRPDPAAASGWRCDPRGRTTAVILGDEYEEWILAHAPGTADTPWLTRAAAGGCGDEVATLPTLTITAPALGSVILLGDRGGAAAQIVDVRVEVDPPGAAALLGEVEFVVDGLAVAQSAYPYRATIPVRAGDHEVLARPRDPRIAARFAPSRFSVR